ncbi:MAG TPA: hypothetical protein VHT26_00075 [Trebonia sp.]|jgi:hypothetical protein|nr:hypothetical protein [Trebonia sp.]
MSGSIPFGSAAGSGPTGGCRTSAEADALAARYPELSLRTEPAHQEAFVALTAGPGGIDVAQFQLASEALRVWAMERVLIPERLDLGPEDLGLRITYLANEPVTKASVPDCDFAVPFALAAGS